MSSLILNHPLPFLCSLDWEAEGCTVSPSGGVLFFFYFSCESGEGLPSKEGQEVETCLKKIYVRAVYHTAFRVELKSIFLEILEMLGAWLGLGQHFWKA